jgi:two-component system, chemotaxis family, chemotaxis protein CheY
VQRYGFESEASLVMINCLLIEKNPSERLRLSEIISGLGLSCSESSGAEEGLKFCQDQHPDVVMMEATTTEAAKEFMRLVGYQGRRTGRPVVILYADRPDMAIMADSIMDGAADFLMKPFDRDLLQFKLQQAGVLPH